MGRGKKKGGDDKKAATPSTSETAPTQPVEQEAKDVPEESKPEESDTPGLGLGLGPSKSRNRKKKGAAAKADSSGAQSSSGPPPATQAPSVPPLATQAPPPVAIQTSLPPPTAQTPIASAPPGFPQAPEGAVGWAKPSASIPGQVAPAPSLQPTFQPPQGLQKPPDASHWGSAASGKGRGAGEGGGRGRGRGGQYPNLGPPGGPPQTPIVTPQQTLQQTPQFRPELTPQSKPQPAPQSRPQPRSQPVETFSRLKIPPKIIGQKVKCQRVQVITNYLAMSIQPLKIHRYDVSFKPDKPKKLIPKAFIAVKTKCFPRSLIAFDQMKNCYCLQPLPKVVEHQRFADVVEIVDANGKAINFEVSFKFTGIVDLGTITQYMSSGGTSLNPPTEAIQCVDVILRQGTLESYIKAGRQFFRRPRNPVDLGDGLEMWTGLFQSAIFTSQPFINIDVAHKGFPRQQPLIQALVQDFKLDPKMPIDQQRGYGVELFTEFIKGLRVVANIGGDSSAKGQKREYIVNGLVDQPSKLKFQMKDDKNVERTITVADYFTLVKKCRLSYPNLNCVWVGPRDRSIYYPMELLEVAYGQPRSRQLNDKQLSTMVRVAAAPPNDRKKKIEEVIRDMNYSQNTFFKQFGLNISNEFYPVEAKVLSAPRLNVGSRTVEPRGGAWQANSLLKPEALRSWGFVVVDVRDGADVGSNTIKLVMRVGQSLGMSVAEPQMTHYNAKATELLSIMSKAVEKGINFIFIVVGTRNKDLYHRVKRVAELEVGVLTQCIKEYTAMRRMNDQTMRNILLKVNSKLKGVNQAIDNSSMPPCLKEPGVMIVGADVTHPSPDQSNIPSIAAVSASFDQRCYEYNIQLSVQSPKTEIIVEFEDMMLEHLQVYVKNQKYLPRKIYIFRDGVSEGQFAHVMDNELQAIHRAYQRLSGGKATPEVLFLLVQKRHHTRFFLGKENAQNVAPGTVVDTNIVHARELDFYLVSHHAIKGTARPTRYHAVCNDGKIPQDEVEQLTFFLCHLYSRCMRSVSYPTPTYYAHLACNRARSLTHGDRFDNAELERRPRRLRVLNRMLEQSRMFFV